LRDCRVATDPFRDACDTDPNASETVTQELGVPAYDLRIDIYAW